LEKNARYWWSSNFCLKSKQIHILHKCWYQCWQKSLELYTTPPLPSVLYPLWCMGFSNTNVICKGTYLTVTVRLCKPLLQPFTRCQNNGLLHIFEKGVYWDRKYIVCEGHYFDKVTTSKPHTE
jgi:hypothetical protein